MQLSFLSGYELGFLIDLILCLIIGFVIGAERESRGKPAGISTHSFVIIGAMTFSFISSIVDPASKTRVAAQIVTGVGFLGAGMIMKGENGFVANLTTAASIWFAAAIGMSIGFNLYSIALMSAVAAFFIPRIPHIKHPRRKTEKTDTDETGHSDDGAD